MDYKPRYIQPFTLTEATALDVAVISEEIARLQNSLQRLNNTQSILEKVVNQSGPADPELCQAFEENRTVIGSQKERITILEMALREKGVISGSHYSTPVESVPPQVSEAQASVIEESMVDTSPTDADVDGVYL